MLQAYLRRAGRLPEILKDENETQNHGYFAPFQGKGEKGKVVLGKTGDATTLVHELTHAADIAMAFQFQDTPNYPHVKRTSLDDKITTALFGKKAGAKFDSERTPEQDQFYDGYQKLSRDQPAVLAKRMNPKWTKEQEDYRSSPLELRGHAIGNTIGARNESQKDLAPLHIDSTLATEFSIMLDLAQRAIFGDK